MNLRQARNKIKTVSNVKKITRAMQLVSAIKMKKAQQEFIEGKPYRETLEKMIKTVIRKINPKVSKFLKEEKVEKEIIILLSSNKGLCGSFNVNLFNFLLKSRDLQKSEFVSVGKRGSDILNLTGYKVLADYSSNQPLSVTSAVFDFVLGKFLKNEYQQVSVVYNKFISTIRIVPTKETILSVKFPDGMQEKIEEEYLIEPAPELIIDSVLRSFVEEKIRDAIMSSEAGEHSARMMAMKNATDNATDLILELTMLRNKLRQTKITYELLDMITAKESVEEEE